MCHQRGLDYKVSAPLPPGLEPRAWPRSKSGLWKGLPTGSSATLEEVGWAKGAVSDGLWLSAFQENVLSCQNEEFKLIKVIKVVQKSANLYTVQPDEHFGTWFQAVEPLSEEASYSLSCQLEPRYQWTRKIRLFFKDKKSHSSSRPGLNTRPRKKSPVVVAGDAPETS
nr:ral guanine nucleotide dissociation stimulator-like 1 isoform X2 [Equus asinus]